MSLAKERKMPDALKTAAMSMQSDMARLDSISQNLANVATSGYKREVAINRTFASHVAELATDVQADASMVARDVSPGTFRATGNPLDIAIEGEGFFEVMTDNGVAYTRQGGMRVDSRGRLVNAQGAALMGMGGELSVTNAPIAIDANGEVKQGERVAGQIKIVRFTNQNALLTLGNGLFSQGGARVSDGSEKGRVRTGYLENSNVNSAQEMVRLTETMRHFEAMQRVIQGYDDVYQKALRKFGEF
jgi:flagellar basal-body rod protein FlgF